MKHILVLILVGTLVAEIGLWAAPRLEPCRHREPAWVACLARQAGQGRK